MLSRLAPIDRWVLSYTGVTTAFLLWRWPEPPRAWLFLLGHVLLALLVLLAAHARQHGGLLAEFYPLLVLYPLYAEVGALNAVGGVSHDHLVQAWEQALFGGQPSLGWIRTHPSTLLSWAMHVGYVSMYPIIVIAPLGLWVSGRRNAARRTLLLMMVTFYLCYTIFLLFPVAGPRFLFAPATNQATDTVAAELTNALVSGLSAWGTAFPSSHVAVTLVASVSAWLFWRRLGAPLFLLALLLALGTVYGQFHYAVDAVGGILVALVVLACRERLWRNLGATTYH